MNIKRFLPILLLLTTLGGGGLGAREVVDIAEFSETKIERSDRVAEYLIETKQTGNVVETRLPWKDQDGLTVKYDMGEPNLEERRKDKRNQQVVTETVDFGDGGFKIDILLNEKPKHNVFCYTIEGADEYDFFYQSPLTKEQISNGVVRPENIVGSYAVYHKVLRDNQYQTGKVMHIPRPQVWEVDNKEATTEWADLSYNKGELCVTVSASYLTKANYPVRVDPTFGYTSIGATNFSIASYEGGGPI